MPVPANPKIYHICHVDRLPSIVSENGLLCDAEIARRGAPGTGIGMVEIKKRRRNLPVNSYPDLYVGDCVPFYFCPRSIMLYVIAQRNHRNLVYQGGQGPIIHLEADLRQTVAWADEHDRRWAFTLSNAAITGFIDRNDLTRLDEINWGAVHAAIKWNTRIEDSIREGKQAEFLVEHRFPWTLVASIGVQSQPVRQQAMAALAIAAHKPRVEIKRQWYY